MGPVVHRFSVLKSTQEEARRLLRDGEADIGHVIFADRQTAGRGRFGHDWISPIGGLYATFILDQIELPSIHAGVCVVAALERRGLFAHLKWPNDVVAGGKKLAGILVETAGERILAGVGVNLIEAPLPTATSTAVLGVKIDRESLLQAIWEELGERRSLGEMVDNYRRACSTIGCHVRLIFAGGRSQIQGIAEDIDEQGRLVVATADGRRTISSGECEHLRVAATVDDWTEHD